MALSKLLARALSKCLRLPSCEGIAVVNQPETRLTNVIE
jgi:hypothetical protein